MALPIRPKNPTPIPNNPFYSPETSFIYGTNGWFNLGNTLCVNNSGYINVSSGGGGGGVTALAAGPGIALSSTTGAITVCTNLLAGTNIALTPVGNQITVSATGAGTGTVTLVAAGNGLSGGPITTSGSLSLNTNCVIQPSAFALKGNLLVGTGAGTYLALNPGTDGQVLVACGPANAAGLCWGSAGTVSSVTGTLPISVATGTTTPAISIAAASTTASGAVQLNDTLVSTSTTLALTAAQGKVLQDQINTLLVAGTIELAGTIDASTGLVASVTSVGTADGYTVGAVLPAASATTNNTYAIVTTPGTMTPPGGSSTVATRGDWFLVSETSPGVFAWTFLNVGFDAPAASTTVAGIVELATNAETATGTDATTAVTPAGAASAYIAKTALTAKGALVSATAASTPSALAVGTDGQVLVACAAATTGLCWTAPAASGIPCACITAKGSLVSGTAAATPTALPVGTDGNILVACSTAATGLCWTAPAPSGIPCACVLGKGALVTGTAGSTPAGLSVGLDGQFLVACAAAATGLCWTAPAPSGIPCACVLGKGALVTGTAGSPPAGLSVGTDGQLLVACAAATTGLCWATVPVTLPATPTVAGIVIGCTDTTNAALGCNALLTGTGTGQVAVGLNSLRANTTGVNNVAVGNAASCSNTIGSGNVAIGTSALCNAVDASRIVAVGENALCAQTTGGQYNVALGWAALCSATGTAGGSNVALGALAGNNITTGSSNVAIGPNVTVPFGNQDSQLAIGYNTGQCWLTGDSAKNVKFWAGIRDYTNSLGTNGQVLTSNGTVAQWATAPAVGPGLALAVNLATVWGATTTAPVLGGGCYGMWCRQAGDKYYQIQMVVCKTANGSAGSGDYLFTLPNGLQFGCGPNQGAYTANVGANTNAFLPASMPGSTGFLTDGSTTCFALVPVVYNATQFRVITFGTGGFRPWNAGWFAASTALCMTMDFQFVST